jgi:hypothetical protein
MLVVRGDVKDTKNLPFNSFKFKFKLNSDTPDGQELRVVLKLKAESEDILLVGSVNHNLPSF